MEHEIEELKTRMSSVEKEVNGLKTSTAVADVSRVTLDKRLEDIEGTLRWLVRLIIGAIIMALIAYVISGGASL